MADRDYRQQHHIAESEDTGQQGDSEFADQALSGRYTSRGAIPPVQESFHDPRKTASEQAFGPSIGARAAPPAKAAPSGDVAKHEEGAERKPVLIENALKFAEFPFEILSKAADAAIESLDVPEIPKTDFTRQLLGIAAGALVGASSGAAVAWLFGSITTVGITGKAASMVQGLIGGAMTKALQANHAQAAASLDDIKRAFRDAHNVQQLAAKQDFIAEYEGIRAGLAALSVEDLVRLNEASSHKDVGVIYAKMKHETFVAWTNFLARVKHGAMGAWDHWTDNGSPGAIELPGAQQRPSAGGRDPTRNNVAPNNNSPLLENTQRPMQADAFGILEIFVDPSGKNVINHPGYRMRLDNVGPEVRKEFRTSGKKVRDLPVNKVVHMCSSIKNGVRVDPPTSIASVMITADGYVRASNWAEHQRVHFEPKQGPLWDPTGFGDCMDQVIEGKETADCHLDRKAMVKEISTFASAAQELPLSWLEA